MTSYTFDAARLTVLADGKPLFTVQPAPALGPAAIDRLGHLVAFGLNAPDLLDRAAEYVERFADLTDAPEGGDCRRVLAQLRGGE